MSSRVVSRKGEPQYRRHFLSNNSSFHERPPARRPLTQSRSLSASLKLSPLNSQFQCRRKNRFIASPVRCAERRGEDVRAGGSGCELLDG
ncbi:hypothetical protein D4764_12G0004760 [Takifugu flavidus]|uniref:Uncharacterized protein n=1 Tax=Takifugu flavidus TaxID=433684 RepID=A0A5C6PCZ2_9TELE|nr:hypothetical protein D4764_12G0004760 [Takifugu flavidus]